MSGMVSESQFRKLWIFESDGQMHSLKLMLRGGSSIRFSAEQKNKTSFSLLVQFFSEFSQIGQKIEFNQFSITSIKLGVGWFFVSAIIRSGWHVKSQIRVSSLVVRVYCISVWKKGVSWVLRIYRLLFSICSNVSEPNGGFVNFVSYFLYDST